MNSSINCLGLLGKLINKNQSKGFNKLINYLSTVNGTDKLFMLIQYTSKILIWFLSKSNKNLNSVGRISRLSSLISDHRVLLRLWGVLPMISWAGSIESERPVSKLSLTLERLQALSMILYYPLENIYYLASQNILPIKMEKANRISIWSCRFWATYTILQLIHLYDDYNQLIKQSRVVKREDEKGVQSKIIRRQMEYIKNDTIIQLSYLPLTIHWSIARGLFSNDIWVGVLGSIAAITQFKVGYKSIN